jgi:hypothetical protein
MSTPASTPFAAAVHSCCGVYQHVLESERAKGTNPCAARGRAEEAYIQAMPYLIDRPSILDFIACVGHAMLLGIIGRDRGSTLLSAARTALAALPPREWQPKGNSKH